MSKIGTFLKLMSNNPGKLLAIIGDKNLFNWLSDEKYLKLIYWMSSGKKLDFENPMTFNEKLQWLKLNDRNEKYHKYVDKYEVREHISESIGEEYLVPLIGVFNDSNEFNWDDLPNQFVLKCTHGSGSNIICTNKNELDYELAKKKIDRWMKKNWFWFAREWPYKNLKPRIICEEFISEISSQRVKDYRVFCFNGEPKFIAVDFDIIEKKKTRRNLYDINWNLMECGISYPRELTEVVQKPSRFNELLEVSRKLAVDIPHVRIDFFVLEDKIYFGEMTFYHQAGLGQIYPEEYSYKFGEWIELPKNHRNNT